MRHLDGITVSLRSKGRAVLEYNNPHCKKINYLHRTIGSRGVALTAGSPFEVELVIDHTFQLHKAGGVIVVIAFHTDHCEAQGTDFAQVLWIPLQPGTGSRHVFSETMLWHEGSANEKHIPYKMPAPAEHAAQATDDWLKSPIYMANRGCLSVHVERGSVDLPKASRERRDAYNSRHTNVEPRRNALNYGSSAYPIRHDWFFSVRSKHAEPYVFEFRNLQPKELDRSTAGNYEFGDEDERDFSDSEDDSVTNDEEIDISETESEGEEAQAEEDELEEDVTFCTTITTDDGSPLNSTLTQRRSSRARKQIHQHLGQFEIFDHIGDETSRSGNDFDGPTLRVQTPTRSGKQKACASKDLREPFSTPRNKAPLQTSSAIKRKLDVCDEDDEEIVPRSKSEKFQTPRPPARESPSLFQDIGSSNGRPSAKRAKLLHRLELLRIEKEEVELRKQLDELDE